MQIKNDILDIFEKYDFYDFVVDKMNMDFAKNSITIKFLLFDDLGDEYVPMSLIFNKVSKFKYSYSDNLMFNVSGSYSASCKEITEGYYETSFVFLLKDMGRDVPALELTIGFSNMDISGGLSNEALKYKYE